MRKLLTLMMMTSLLLPALPARAATDCASDPNCPAVAQYKAGITNKLTVPVFTNGNLTGTTTVKSPDYLSIAMAKQHIPSCNPAVLAYKWQQAQQKSIIDTAKAMAARSQITQGMNNPCMEKYGANGDDVTSVDAAVMAQKEKDLATIESAICSLNFNSLFSGLLGLNLSICKGNKLVSAGLNDTLSKTFLSKAHDITKEQQCLQAQNLNKNLMDNASSDYGLGAVSGTMQTFQNAGALTTGGGGALSRTFGFGTNVNLSANASTNNGINTNTSATTVSGNSTPTTNNIVSIPPDTAAANKPATTPLNIFK